MNPYVTSKRPTLNTLIITSYMHISFAAQNTLHSAVLTLTAMRIYVKNMYIHFKLPRATQKVIKTRQRSIATTAPSSYRWSPHRRRKRSH